MEARTIPIANRTVWIFDLDNTLYPATASLFPQIERRMREFVADQFDLSQEDAHRLQKKYYHEFGTTLRGLMTVHQLDPKPFLDYVHDIDSDCIVANPRLETALRTLPGRKIVFTNGTRDHAHRILGKLGIGHLFDAVYDIGDAGYVPKPDPAPYEDLIRTYGIDPHQAVMIEDTCVNLEIASRLGMATVWVHPPRHLKDQYLKGDKPLDESAPPSYVDYTVTDLTDWLENLTKDMNRLSDAACDMPER